MKSTFLHFFVIFCCLVPGTLMLVSCKKEEKPAAQVSTDVFEIFPGLVADGLNSTRLPPRIYEMTILEFAGHIRAKTLSSLIVQGDISQKSFRLDFKGGSVRELLEQVAVAVPVRIEVGYNILISRPWKPGEREARRKQMEENAKAPKRADPFASQTPSDEDQAAQAK